MTISPQELLTRNGIAYIATRKGKFTTKCPSCGGGYLNVEEKRDGVVWFCHACQEGGGEHYEPNGNRGDSGLGPIKATFDYHNEVGERLFQVLKFEPLNGPKQFRQRTGPDQKPWSIKGVRIVPYRLPEMIEAIATEHVVFVVEGEKDVETLRARGIPATCNPMGAGKWWSSFNEMFKDGDIVICGDNDNPGRDHVKLVASNLRGVVRRLRVLDLAKFWSEIEESDDITDWFDAGGTVERLWEFVEQLSTSGGDGRDDGDDFGAKEDQKPGESNGGGPSAVYQQRAEEDWRRNGNGARRTAAATEDDGARPPEFSDDALALRFAERHANELRYVAKWSAWLCWDGVCWRFDNTLSVFDCARVICRAAAAGCNKLKLRKELASAKTVAAVERLARSDRRLAATVEQWDADPWLLNTPEGVIDLRTGIMREHRAEDYLTRMTVVAPGNRECPIWHTFLDRVTGGNKALQQYLQRVCGYALTGSTREHALFFLWGTGANGKGTFMNAITGILADFHRIAPIETFTASYNDRHPTDLAGLRGARLVTATETEEGRRWAEAKIKTLTGGDMVSARFMRQDFFDYMPQFKLMIAGNHKPGLRAVDEAIRRRFNLIPFTITIPPDERDHELGEKLKAEWQAILRWMIDGCLDWQERGLAPPEAVTAATAAYLEAQDTFSAWLDECCERDPNAWERSMTLFASWKTWAEQSGQFVGDAKTFRARLERYNDIEHRPEPGTKRAGFKGVRLKPVNHYGKYAEDNFGGLSR